jgi:hypothetical protein
MGSMKSGPALNGDTFTDLESALIRPKLIVVLPESLLSEDMTRALTLELSGFSPFIGGAENMNIYNFPVM